MKRFPPQGKLKRLIHLPNRKELEGTLGYFKVVSGSVPAI